VKQALLLAIVAASLSTVAAAPEPSGFGLGFIAGEPTGLSAKTWTGSRIAFDAAVAWSVYRYAALHVHADVLWHTRNMIRDDFGFLPLYAGLGGRVKLSSGSNQLLIGARIPLGAEYVFPILPLGVFLEVVPIVDLIPATGFNWNSAAGIRYYFVPQGK